MYGFLQEGRVLKNIDVLIFCTGYRFEFPFLEKSGFLQLKQDCVYPVYRQIFHPRYPTLAFTSHPFDISIEMCDGHLCCV